MKNLKNVAGLIIMMIAAMVMVSSCSDQTVFAELDLPEIPDNVDKADAIGLTALGSEIFFREYSQSETEAQVLDSAYYFANVKYQKGDETFTVKDSVKYETIAKAHFGATKLQFIRESELEVFKSHVNSFNFSEQTVNCEYGKYFNSLRLENPSKFELNFGTAYKVSFTPAVIASVENGENRLEMTEAWGAKAWTSYNVISEEIIIMSNGEPREGNFTWKPFRLVIVPEGEDIPTIEDDYNLVKLVEVFNADGISTVDAVRRWTMKGDEAFSLNYNRNWMVSGLSNQLIDVTSLDNAAMNRSAVSSSAVSFSDETYEGSRQTVSQVFSFTGGNNQTVTSVLNTEVTYKENGKTMALNSLTQNIVLAEEAYSTRSDAEYEYKILNLTVKVVVAGQEKSLNATITWRAPKKEEPTPEDPEKGVLIAKFRTHGYGDHARKEKVIATEVWSKVIVLVNETDNTSETFYYDAATAAAKGARVCSSPVQNGKCNQIISGTYCSNGKNFAPAVLSFVDQDNYKKGWTYTPLNNEGQPRLIADMEVADFTLVYPVLETIHY